MVALYVAILLLMGFPLFNMQSANTGAYQVSGYSIYWQIKPWTAVHYWILVIIAAALAGLVSGIIKPISSTGFLVGLAGLVSLIFIQLSMKTEAPQHITPLQVFETVTVVYWVVLFCFVFIIAVSYQGDKDPQKSNQRKSPASPAIHINIITQTPSDNKTK